MIRVIKLIRNGDRDYHRGPFPCHSTTLRTTLYFSASVTLPELYFFDVSSTSTVAQRFSKMRELTRSFRFGGAPFAMDMSPRTCLGELHTVFPAGSQD